jgi:hypothetical protein
MGNFKYLTRRRGESAYGYLKNCKRNMHDKKFPARS